jgi:DNA modification methylase
MSPRHFPHNTSGKRTRSGQAKALGQEESPRISGVEQPSAIEFAKTATLKPRSENARRHSRAQVRQVAESIRAFGFVVPIAIDDDNKIWLGHGRFEAAKSLGLTTVPVIRLRGLSETKKRALAIAENKIAEEGRWDRAILAFELPELADLLIHEELDVSITGFTPVEIDQLAINFDSDSPDPQDDLSRSDVSGTRVTERGDIWQLGVHQLLCADARDLDAIKRLMGVRRAAMAFLNPHYSVSIPTKAVGRDRVKHDEFATHSAENRVELFEFLKAAFHAVCVVSRDGAVHYCCCDWRHVSAMIEAANAVYGEMLNLAVWVKSNVEQDSFYGRQHELVGIFRVGGGQHLNGINLSRPNRARSNVWQYNESFRASRLEDLSSRPSVKPVALVGDAMKDCTRPGDTVIDTFCGCGTTILAAERAGRRAVGVEIEPRYVDFAIYRWRSLTGRDPVLQISGQTLAEVAAARAVRRPK